MFSRIEKELNKSVTENGAVGYKTTESALLDMNYHVISLRQAVDDEIALLFTMAFVENREYAMKWLFFARDARGGLGERRLFRVCYRRLAELDFDLFRKNLPNIAEYGRYDDLISLIGTSEEADTYIKGLIDFQLRADLNNYNDGQPISLLAKWLPSENTSSKKTRTLAKKVRKMLGMTSKEYRQTLSKLRRYSNVVEVQICANEWSEIDYEKVPSLANLRYRNAFLNHDGTRRRDYLDSVNKGEAKLNMNVATPVDVVSRYSGGWYGVKEYDKTLELAWKNLPDVFVKDTLVVADGSGSMTVKVGGNTTALDVANALAIYTSEHNSGEYKNKYITFSNTPQFVKFEEVHTLMEKLLIARKHNEVANTNIEAVFDLILSVAVANEIPEEEMIKNILIISDMEFDAAQRIWRRDLPVLTKPLFDEIKERYQSKGYKLPKLVFWNVNSRTKTIPLIENELGVTLVSGFSQNVLQMVMSNKYDPYEVLIETLDNGRYDKVIF